MVGAVLEGVGVSLGAVVGLSHAADLFLTVVAEGQFAAQHVDHLKGALVAVLSGPGARAKRGVHDAGAVIDVVARVEFALTSLEALDVGLGYFLKVYDHTIVVLVV